ncbi:MAG: hypothetical protein WA324_07090 [Bryobacteraceae bacterium]
MKYLILSLGLLLGAQASMASVVYSFTTAPVGKISPFTFSFDESTFLTHDTLIPDADLEDVSGLPKGFSLNSIGIAFFGPSVTLTEYFNNALPISFFFNDGPWNKPGTFDSLVDAASITISNDPTAPEPGEFGLVLVGALLLMSSWRRVASNFQKCRS